MYLGVASVFLLLFLIWTGMVCLYDVRPIGPEGSSVGFSHLNSFVQEKIGVHLIWYKITNVLGWVIILSGSSFAVLGAWQLITRKSLWKVDKEILIFGIVDILLGVLYVLFEKIVFNMRPVILDAEEGLEASYPSSHTLLSLAVLGCMMILLPRYIHASQLLTGLEIVCVLLCGITIVGRILSGAHWASDIVGSLLLSLAIILFYRGAIDI